MSNDKHDFVGFDKSMTENDFGLIISEDGSLRGIWIPAHLQDEDVPEPIVHFLKHYYDINPNDEHVYGGTIH